MSGASLLKAHDEQTKSLISLDFQVADLKVKLAAALVEIETIGSKLRVSELVSLPFCNADLKLFQVYSPHIIF